MMNLTTVPKSFWIYALESAIRILNMVSTKKVEMTPYEIWPEKAPKLSYLRVWGYNQLWVLVELPPNGGTVRSKWIFKKKTNMDGNVHTFKACLVAKGNTQTYDVAINMEIQSMKDNQLWVLVELPPNGGTVRSKWIFKKKTNMDGNVHTFKACLVAKGNTQTYDVGEAAYILGIKIIRDRSKRLIALGQSAYLEITLKKFRMENSKKSRFQQNPGEIHWTAVKTILKYLRNTKDMVLVYREKPEAELRVSCYANASFQTDKDDTKSQTNMCSYLMVEP
nr:hypothetical protein [Tanacetum cinerariifolium]